MNQLTYIPGTVGADAIGMDGNGSFVGIASNLRSREWAYKLGYRDIETANRPAREVSLDFETDYATADAFRRAADADVLARTPGMFLAQGEWRQRGYITSSEPSYIHYGRLGVKLGCILLEGAWWRVRSQSFAAENTVIEDRYESATGEQVVTVGADSAPLHSLIVEGKSVQDGTPSPDNPIPIQVIGGMKWNQLTRYPQDASNWSITNSTSGKATTSVSNGKLQIVSADASTYSDQIVLRFAIPQFLSGHKYMLTANVANNTATARWNFLDGWAGRGSTTDKYGVDDAILSPNADSTGSAYTSITVKPGQTTGAHAVGYTITISDVFTIDLTAIYGAGNEPTTLDDARIAFIKTYALYHPEYTTDSTADEIFISVTSNGQTEITPIDLQGNVLASLPDGTKDTLTVDPTGHVTLTKNVMRRIYDGSDDEGWLHYNYTAGHGYYLPTSSFSPVASNRGPNMINKALCNRFVVDGSDAACTSGEMYFDSNACPDFVYPAVTTVEAWRTFLASNNVELFYKPAASQTVDLGYIDMPDVYDGAVVDVIAEVTPTITAEWKLANIVYLDYPHDYQYDYMKSSNNTEITTSVLTPSDVRITIFGAVSNPYIIVGENRYQVNVTVPAGGYLEIDGRNKTITLTLADGTQQNVFGAGVRGSGMGGGEYIFEPIKGGAQQVQWSGAFGFDLAWYEDEGEPPWSR